MAKPLLILLHGMGAPSKDWAKEYIASLDSLGATFPGLEEKGAFSEQVVLKPLHYDHVFQDLLDRWETEGSKVDGFLKEKEISLPRVSAFLKDNTIPPDERGFFWTHVMDPVTYRGTTLIRDEVQATVVADVAATINAHLDAHEGAEVSILGYSLGTIVTHDLLHLLGSGGSSPSGRVWKSDRFRFANVFQVANASRLGPPALLQFNPYKSVVRPVSAGEAPSGDKPYAGYFYNFRNEWDPVASWQRFSPPDWGRGFFDVSLRHIHQANVHGLGHYLSHPEVHVRLFRALLGTKVISRSSWQERVSDFPNLPSTPCTATVAALMQELDSLKTAVTGGKIDDVAMGMLGAYRAIRKAKEACAELFNKVDGWL
jgi:hypothetical protein